MEIKQIQVKDYYYYYYYYFHPPLFVVFLLVYASPSLLAFAWNLCNLCYMARACGQTGRMDLVTTRYEPPLPPPALLCRLQSNRTKKIKRALAVEPVEHSGAQRQRCLSFSTPRRRAWLRAAVTLHSAPLLAAVEDEKHWVVVRCPSAGCPSFTLLLLFTIVIIILILIYISNYHFPKQWCDVGRFPPGIYIYIYMYIFYVIFIMMDQHHKLSCNIPSSLVPFLVKFFFWVWASAAPFRHRLSLLSGREKKMFKQQEASDIILFQCRDCTSTTKGACNPFLFFVNNKNNNRRETRKKKEKHGMCCHELATLLWFTFLTPVLLCGAPSLRGSAVRHQELDSTCGSYVGSEPTSLSPGGPSPAQVLLAGLA
eukprot:gene13318-9154_t